MFILKFLLRLYSPVLRLFADFGEFLINAFFLYQLIMRSALGNPSVINNQNLIRILNRSQSVRYGNNRFAARQFRNCLLNEILILGVDACRRFIKNNNRSIFKHHSRNGNTLFFAARKPLSGFACRRIVPLRQLIDKFFTLCGFCGGFDLFIGCLRITEAYIFKQRTTEQDFLPLSQVLRRHFSVHRKSVIRQRNCEHRTFKIFSARIHLQISRLLPYQNCGGNSSRPHSSVR